MTHEDERERTLREYVDVVTGRKSEYDFEHRVRAKDGAWKWIRSRGRVVERDAHGRARRLAGINEDVTARKEAEERVCAERRALPQPARAFVGLVLGAGRAAQVHRSRRHRQRARPA